jgi:hypothetical protein
VRTRAAELRSARTAWAAFPTWLADARACIYRYHCAKLHDLGLALGGLRAVTSWLFQWPCSLAGPPRPLASDAIRIKTFTREFQPHGVFGTWRMPVSEARFYQKEVSDPHIDLRV